jgi:hypothetical protein
MKDILILHYHSGRADGALTSMIDLYLNLKERIPDIKFKIMTKNAAGQVIQLFLKHLNFGLEENVLTIDTEFEADTIIASTKLLADIGHYQKDLNIRFVCNKLILIDSLDLMRSKCGMIPHLDQFVPCKDTVLLANPANFNISSFECYEYYHKFNETRIGSSLPSKYLVYTRVNKPHIQLADNILFENIGKSMWECLYNNQSIFYYSDGMKIKDGLYYYLKLFGVDGSMNHIPLNISKEQVIDKLFMKDDDLLLNILGGSNA